MAAKVKEIILDPHLGDPQQILPEPGQAALDIVARRDVIRVEIRALETLAGFTGRDNGSGLADQRRQIQRRDQDLRQACIHRAAENPGALFRTDALA